MTKFPTFDDQMSVIRHVLYRLLMDYHDFHNYTIVMDYVAMFKVEIIKDDHKAKRAVVYWPYAFRREAEFTFHAWRGADRQSIVLLIEFDGGRIGLIDRKEVYFPSDCMTNYSKLQDTAMAVVQVINSMLEGIANRTS